MTIVFFIFAVGLIPSITVVDGRLDLRAFEHDDVPFAFSCRRGRCSRLSSTRHRQSPVTRSLGRFDGVDDLVGEASRKPFGGNDYDEDDNDGAVGRRSFQDDRWIMTFPYCSTLNIAQCRSLLRHLERLRQQQLRGVTKRNVVVRGLDGTVVELLSRRRRSVPGADTGNKKTAETPKVRAVRSPNAAFEASNRLLDQYREWRRRNGYGRNNARWGRSGPPSERQYDGTARKHSKDFNSDKDSLTTTSNSTKVRQRSPRSVVVEIEPEEELPDNERDMLDTYLAWRETHGYGTLAGRWG